MFLAQSVSGAPNKSFEVRVDMVCYRHVNTMVLGEMVLERLIEFRLS